MLKLRDIKKTYVVDDKHFPALKNINLTFPNKGFISILGPSGCGKTTLLNLIGGLDQYTSGDLIINNKSTKKFTDRDWDAYRNKRVGFVFQTYNLVPHLTVLGNVELSMTLTGMSKKERQRKATLALKRVGLKEAIKKKPNQLSGGQMQRVAIARSLVNNPEIVLADEPTGALDSVTSVQVMEILKEVAKDRLVIMVTHNVELAKKYSTRIIRLKDGLVIGDSNPQKASTKKDKEALEQEKNKHTHMSFFTALGSSAKSLLTKKGRTIMTAVAASFGIIGVSLVLAMSNGFTNYVNNVEIATASTVPISISPYVTTNIKDEALDWKPWPSEHEIIPYDDKISSQFETHRNIITDEYGEYCRKLLEDPQHYASSVLVNHEGLDFNIFTERPKMGSANLEVIKVDQYASAGTTGSVLSNIGGLPSSIFHELYGGEEYIRSLYDIVQGHFPTNKNEVVLVCDRYNRLPIETLYQLGYLASDKQDKYDPISFEDICKKTYKAYLPQEVYGESKKVTKIIPACKKLASDGDKTYLNIIQDDTNKEITQYFDIASKDEAGEYKYPDLLKSFYNDGTKHPVELKVVGVIRPSRTSLINLMPGSICYTTELKDYFQTEINKPENEIYRSAARNNWAIKESTTQENWNELLKEFIGVMSGTSNLNTFMGYFSKCVSFYGALTSDKTTEPTEILSTSSSYAMFQANAYKFSTKFEFDPEKDSGLEGEWPVVVMYLVNGKTLLDAVTYINGYSTITSILIFPKDLANKNNIFTYLDKYNEGKPNDNTIMYSDIAGDITDAIGTLVQVISVVLIIFSSISLLVSCVMTGVITYTSVLERTKEIGILRAIGARKKDVGRLFEAESVIIGGIGGLIGVIVTFIAEWPISLIINNRFPSQNIGMICNLNPWHAILLVAVSILLTFISGFIPARKAAKKDPVVALRTE